MICPSMDRGGVDIPFCIWYRVSWEGEYDAAVVNAIVPFVALLCFDVMCMSVP